MKKKYISLLLSVVMATSMITGCNKDSNVEINQTEVTSTDNQDNNDTQAQIEIENANETNDETEPKFFIGNVEVSQAVKEKIDNMTIEEKICQMIMPAMRYWYNTPEEKENVQTLNSEQYDFLKKYNFGGVCLFAQNCSGTEQMVRLTNELQKAAGESETKIPMLLSIDQEGGYVTRLATGTSGIGNMALAATGDSTNARTQAGIISEELKALGINIDFGPDTDVNNNPDNPVIGIRSFSDDPKTVAEFGLAYINGLHDNNIMSCIKHFPGHGDTNTDSHVGFPYIDKSLDELNSIELIPFKSLSDSTDMVMTAHIQFPQIEKTTYTSISTGEDVYIPATMSKTIITDILRNEIGYEGVVSTDALDMDAIHDNFELLDVAEYAINADVDILLMPVKIESTSGLEDMEKFISDVSDMVKSGKISEDQIDDSVARILNLKEKYNLISEFDTDVEARVENALQTVGSKAHHDSEWELALNAVTEYRNNLENLEVNENTKILYICPLDSQLNSFEIARRKLVDDLKLTESQQITLKSYDGIESDISETFRQDIGDTDIVILVSKATSLNTLDTTNNENVNACFCKNILKISKELGKKTIFISSQLPYDAPLFDADSVYLVYNPSGVTELPDNYNGEVKKYGPNLPAAIYIALSGGKASGQCPVNIEFE